MPTISIALVKKLSAPEEKPFKMRLENAMNLVQSQPNEYEIVDSNYIEPTAVAPIVQKKSDADVVVEVIQGPQKGTKKTLTTKTKKNAGRN